MLGIMKDKRQLLKENTHSSKDTEEQTTCSLKHNWKVASPLHSTCFPKLGAAWETAALFLLFLLTLRLEADERLFPSQRWGKKTPNRPSVLHQLCLHCFKEGHIYIQLCWDWSWLKGWLCTWAKFWSALSALCESLWWVLEAGNMIHPKDPSE